MIHLICEPAMAPCGVPPGFSASAVAANGQMVQSPWRPLQTDKWCTGENAFFCSRMSKPVSLDDPRFRPQRISASPHGDALVVGRCTHIHAHSVPHLHLKQHAHKSAHAHACMHACRHLHTDAHERLDTHTCTCPCACMHARRHAQAHVRTDMHE